MAKSSIKTLREFMEISREFSSKKFGPQTVARLIVAIRDSKGILTEEQLQALIEVPADVLERDVELTTDEDEWASANGVYFAGNINIKTDEYLNSLREKFESMKFTLEDVCDLTRHAGDRCGELGRSIEYLLRIPELTLRDHVRLRGSSEFEQSGKAFSKHIDVTLGL